MENKDDFKSYKQARSDLKTTEKNLGKSIEIEGKIDAAIKNFEKVDKQNFDKVNNLTFVDGKGVTQSIDITIKAGNAFEYEGLSHLLHLQNMLKPELMPVLVQ